MGSLTLRPAGLLDSLTKPLSRNLVLQVTLYTSLKLRGRTTELPRSDFNRQVIRFTRHTLQVLKTVSVGDQRLPLESLTVIFLDKIS